MNFFIENDKLYRLNSPEAINKSNSRIDVVFTNACLLQGRYAFVTQVPSVVWCVGAEI